MPFPTQGEELETRSTCRRSRSTQRAGSAGHEGRVPESRGPPGQVRTPASRPGSAGPELPQREKLRTQPAEKLLRLMRDRKLSENFCQRALELSASLLKG